MSYSRPVYRPQRRQRRSSSEDNSRSDSGWLKKTATVVGIFVGIATIMVALWGIFKTLKEIELDRIKEMTAQERYRAETERSKERQLLTELQTEEERTKQNELQVQQEGFQLEHFREERRQLFLEDSLSLERLREEHEEIQRREAAARVEKAEEELFAALSAALAEKDNSLPALGTIYRHVTQYQHSPEPDPEFHLYWEAIRTVVEVKAKSTDSPAEALMLCRLMDRSGLGWETVVEVNRQALQRFSASLLNLTWYRILRKARDNSRKTIKVRELEQYGYQANEAYHLHLVDSSLQRRFIEDMISLAIEQTFLLDEVTIVDVENYVKVHYGEERMPEDLVVDAILLHGTSE